MTDDTHLRKLAEAATPGRWHACRVTNNGGAGLSPVEVVADDAGEYVADCHMSANTTPDAQYIAATNPQTIIRLLDERDRLQRALEVARAELIDNLSAEALAIADEAIDAILGGDHA